MDGNMVAYYKNWYKYIHMPHYNILYLTVAVNIIYGYKIVGIFKNLPS